MDDLPKHHQPDEDLPPRYLDQGKPHCLVAEVLVQLGFPLSTLQALDHEYRQGELLRGGVKIDESSHPALRTIGPSAIKLLAYMQSKQNSGMAWGAIARQAFASAWFTLPRVDRARRPWLYE